MPVITITGLSGSGAPEVGAEVSRKLDLNYVDRLILAQTARKMGITVEAIADRTERSQTFGDRLAGFVRTVLERSAIAGGGTDPYFGGGLDAMLVREYRDIPESQPETELNDKKLLEVTSAVVQEMAQSNNVVIIGRGANVILRDHPGALHVWLVSSLEQRVLRVMDREQLDRPGSDKFVAENDRARTGYFHRFFKVDPQDPQHYHLTLNTDWLGITRAADVVSAAAASLNAKPRASMERS